MPGPVSTIATKRYTNPCLLTYFVRNKQQLELTALNGLSQSDT